MLFVITVVLVIISCKPQLTRTPGMAVPPVPPPRHPSRPPRAWPRRLGDSLVEERDLVVEHAHVDKGLDISRHIAEEQGLGVIVDAHVQRAGAPIELV